MITTAVHCLINALTPYAHLHALMNQDDGPGLYEFFNRVLTPAREEIPIEAVPPIRPLHFDRDPNQH